MVGSLQQENLDLDTYKAPQVVLRRGFRLSSMHLDATERDPAVWAAILSGVGLGLMWGIAARIWMRLISTNPEFTISGTAAIFVIAMLFGASVGLAFAARRRGWRRWGHYLPRGLVIAFFVPFSGYAGAPLMFTVLLATLAVTQPAIVGLWVAATLAILMVVGTDIGVPPVIAVILSIGAIALTLSKWIMRRWQADPRLFVIDVWLQRAGRTIILLLAGAGFVFVAWQVVTDKPGLLAPVYILLYFCLLFPLFLGLRVALEPKMSAVKQEVTPFESSTHE
jgi:hypothetical protein